MKWEYSNNDTGPRDRRIDVGVITIIPREVEAVFHVLGIDAKQPLNVSRPLDYWEAYLVSVHSDEPVRIVVTFLNGTAGNTEAAITTASFLRDWYPKVMCLVGIAAGAEGKARIGDVVIPDKIHDVCVTVRTEEGELPRDDVRNRDELINRMLKLRHLTVEQLNSEVRMWLGDDLGGAGTAVELIGLSSREFVTQLHLHDGSLVSGNRLLRDSGYLADFRATKDEKCVGGEMEAAGFTRACEIESVPWIVVRGISDFGDARKSDSFQKLAAYSAASALRILLTDVLDLSSLSHAIPAIEHETVLGTNIVEELTAAYMAGRWEQTVLIGKFLSRPFWVSGKYELRCKVGEMVEDAAAKSGDTVARVAALIDDLGWTSFVRKDIETATKYIEDGLRLAQANRHYYYIAKAHRHLASIYRRSSNTQSARQHLSQAKKACMRLSEGADRHEMEASLYSSEAQLLMVLGRRTAALKLLSEAQRRFADAHDRVREVKLFSLRGEIYEALGQLDDAAVNYRRGYQQAHNLGRKDVMLANARLLGKLFAQLQKPDDAIEWLGRAVILAHNIGLLDEVRDIRRIIVNIQKTV